MRKVRSKMTSPPNRSGRTGFGANGNANDKGAGSIDREAKCPLLLRVFCASSRHNSLSDYNKGKKYDFKKIMKISKKRINYCNYIYFIFFSLIIGNE